MGKNFKILTVIAFFLIFSSCSGGGTVGTGGTGGGVGVSTLKATLVTSDNQPIPNVTAINQKDKQTAVSDQNGNFEFVVNKKGETLEIAFNGAGFENANIRLELPASDGFVFVIFKGDKINNRVEESGIRVEDRNDDSNDSSEDQSDDNSGSESQNDDNNSDDDNSGSGSSDDGGSNGSGSDDGGGGSDDGNGSDDNSGHGNGTTGNDDDSNSGHGGRNS